MDWIDANNPPDAPTVNVVVETASGKLWLAWYYPPVNRYYELYGSEIIRDPIRYVIIPERP